MGEIVSTFHLDIKLILAQLVNFFIILGVMYKFAYRPTLKMLNDRSEKIAKSLEQAKEIETKLVSTEEDRRSVIAEARKEATAIVEKSRLAAEERREEMIAKAKEEIGQIIDQEKEKIRAEKGEALKAIRTEVAELVTLAVEKVLAEKMTKKEDKELIKKIVKEDK
ncbi:F0F1 ATP synthase subunit B [Candidatus Falkowbacteria bacterium]|nr:F0F1 ATP synthase subunit B [Candidatus Falkowbacteria bacterium]